MEILVVIGIIGLLFGLMLLISPKKLKIINEKANRAFISFEDKIYKFHVGAGVSSILISGLCLFIAYYLIKKYG